MTEVEAVVYASVVGAGAGLGGALLNGFVQRRLERERELRTAVQFLAASLASATHSMGWLSWRAEHRPHSLKQEHFDEYDNEIHERLTTVTARKAGVIALDSKERTRTQVDKVVKCVYDMDVKVAKSGVAFENDREAGTAQLARLLSEIRNLEDAVGAECAKILKIGWRRFLKKA